MPDTLEISEDMMAKIAEIEDTSKFQHKIWSAEEDAILLKYWKVKNKSQLSKVIGVSETTARERYLKLTKDYPD
ncbi:hypothetical protein B4O97_03375 [Marispirochaeta aestuarii]|uniref:Myb-like domain-containing protein n=2 Tax=Marispirochaeta aestuarii TaxID=1963862 RepID=A0A1Y1S1D2_9SPIO|nr:hypothetical protein B4O97_03375 [Marispirochaeta aestuarii]